MVSHGGRATTLEDAESHKRTSADNVPMTASGALSHPTKKPLPWSGFRKRSGIAMWLLRQREVVQDRLEEPRGLASGAGAMVEGERNRQAPMHFDAADHRDDVV